MKPEEEKKMPSKNEQQENNKPESPQTSPIDPGELSRLTNRMEVATKLDIPLPKVIPKFSI
jgi:hypothetical protein